MAGRLSQVAGTLSGGEQQMCAIARGLMNRPQLIMIDELSLGLAPLVVDEILRTLPGIAAAGTAILLVEQDVDTSLSMSTRGYVLETGIIALSGLSPDLRTNPRIQRAYLPRYVSMSGWSRDPCAGELGQADRTEIIRALPQRGIHLTSLSYLLNYCEATGVQQSNHLGRREEAQPRLAEHCG